MNPRRSSSALARAALRVPLHLRTRGRDVEGDPVIIRGWFVVRNQLRGFVTGHPDAPHDGAPWTTAPVVGVRGKLAVTATGRHYFLSAPRDATQYARLRQFCRDVRI